MNEKIDKFFTMLAMSRRIVSPGMLKFQVHHPRLGTYTDGELGECKLLFVLYISVIIWAIVSAQPILGMVAFTFACYIVNKFVRVVYAFGETVQDVIFRNSGNATINGTELEDGLVF